MKNIRFIGKQWTLEYADGVVYATNQSARTWTIKSGWSLERSGKIRGLPKYVEDQAMAMLRARNKRRARRNSSKRGITRKLARAALIVGSKRRHSRLKRKLGKRMGKGFYSRRGKGWVRRAALLPKRRR